MPATIRLPTPLRRHADQAKTVEVNADSVGAALAELVQVYPAMKGSIYDDGGELKPFVRLFVGGRDVADLAGMKTGLAEGDVVSIVPPVAGA